MQLSCTLRAVDQWDRSAAGHWAGSSWEQRLLGGGWRRWAWNAQGIHQWLSRKSELKSYWPSTENESQGVQTQGLQFKPGFAFHIIEKLEVFQFHWLKAFLFLLVRYLSSNKYPFWFGSKPRGKRMRGSSATVLLRFSFNAEDVSFRSAAEKI